ncbi:MAG: tetratricopeptide repeat protein [Promethearchaeota archaeon]|nr:MAG: tetratricopeptide repeat protein [Candidatus Lokiarchaeota archaeon]
MSNLDHILPLEFHQKSDKEIFEKGLALYSQHQYAEALPFFQHLTDSAFEMLKYYHLGLTYVQLGQLETGLNYYRRIREVPAHVQGIEYDRIMYGLYLNMGSTLQVLAKQKDYMLYNESIECYKFALEIKDSDHRVWNNLGNAYIEVDRYPAAIEAFQRALQLEPEYSEAHYSLSLAYEFSSQYPQALQHLKEALKDKPRNKMILNRIAAIEFGSGNFLEAQQYTEQILQLYPDDATATKSLTLILYNLGEYAQAYQYYQKFKVLVPDFADNQVLGIFRDLEKRIAEP